MKKILLPAALACVAGAVTAAPIALNGSMQYTQNFDALAKTPDNNLASESWNDDTTIPGWFLYRAGNGPGTTPANMGFAPTNYTYRVTDGSLQSGQTNNLLNTGWFYSMGTLEGTPTHGDRALGSVPITAQGEFSSLAVFQNTSPTPVKLNQIAYNAEIWRTNQDANTIETIAVWWRKAATQAELLTMTTATATVADWPADVATTPSAYYVTGWNRVANAGFTSSSVDANTKTYESHPVSAVPASVIEVLPGEFLAVRFSNINDRGADALMGIDDLTLTFAASDLAVTGVAGDITRDPVGTPRDPSNDTVNFTLTVNGVGAVGPSWRITSPASLASVTGTYGVPATVTGVAISEFTGASHVLTLTVADQNNPAINAPVQVVAPWCQITPAAASGFTYLDKGTAVTTDDEVTYTLNAAGIFTGASYSLGAPGSSLYDTPLIVTAAAPGTYTTHTFTDSADPACTATLNVFPPGIMGINATTLSPRPLLSEAVGQNGGIRWTLNPAAGTIVQTNNPLQLDYVLNSEVVDLSTVGAVEFSATLVASTAGGTSGWEAADFFSIDLIIDGAPAVSALGTSDSDADGRLTGTVELPAAAGVATTFDFTYPIPAAANSVQVRITGNSNSANETFTISNLSVAIPQPEITLSAASNIVRNANGNGLADDTVSFDVTVAGANGGAGWITTGATPASGAFGTVTFTVPAGANSVVLRVTDNTYPQAFADVTVALPGPYIIGDIDLGAGSIPVFTDTANPPAEDWKVNAGARTITMNDGDAIGGAGVKTVTSEVIDLSGASGPVNFSANLHIHDTTSGFDNNDTLVVQLIYDGDTGTPVRLTDRYDTDLNGVMNGAELCPAPAVNPTIQDLDHPFDTVIPDNVQSVQLVITGLCESPNETMIIQNIRFAIGAPDADSDGMSDAYEDANGLDKNSPADRNLDLDGDGQTNYQEFLAGTVANSSASFLQIVDGTLNPATGAGSSTWTSVAGKRYRIQLSGDLATWTDSGSIINATGATTTASYTIPGAPLTGKGFLRVTVVP